MIDEETQNMVKVAVVDYTSTYQTALDTEIENDSMNEYVVKFLVDLVKERKSLEGQRDRILRPMKEAMREATSFFQEPLGMLASIEKVLREKVSAYKAGIDAMRKNAALKAAEAAAQNDMQAVQRFTAAVPTGDPKAKGISYRDVWDYEIEDIAQVPLTYLAVDHSKVMNAIRDAKGKIEIPGIRIIKDTKVTVRTK